MITITAMTMVVIMVTAVNADRHYCKCGKIRWVVSIIIWRVVGYIRR